MNSNSIIIDFQYLKKQIWENYKIQEKIGITTNINNYIISNSFSKNKMRIFQKSYFNFIKNFLEIEFPPRISVFYICFEKKENLEKSISHNRNEEELLKFYQKLKIEINKCFENLAKNDNNVHKIGLKKIEKKSITTIIKEYGIEMKIDNWQKEN